VKKKRVGLVNKKNRKLNLEVFECNFFEQGRGLIFSRRKNAKILLFRFKKLSHLSIHSFFVFFPFIAVWTDDKNRILSWKKVSPFTFHISPPSSGFYSLIEIPVTKEYSKQVNFFK